MCIEKLTFPLRNMGEGVNYGLLYLLVIHEVEASWWGTDTWRHQKYKNASASTE